MMIAIATTATLVMLAIGSPTVQGDRPKAVYGGAGGESTPTPTPTPKAKHKKTKAKQKKKKKIKATPSHGSGEAREEVCTAADHAAGTCVQPQSSTNENNNNNMRFPNGWEEFSYLDIREYFDCDYRSADLNKPLPSLEDWTLLQKTYTQVVDKDQVWDDPIPPTEGYSFVKGDDVNTEPTPPPYYPKFSKGKGRGLFASRNIRKGEVVHDGTHSDVIFPTANDWRRFVFSLPSPKMSCDCTDWHWIERFEEGGEYVFVAGINISSLMNSGGEEYGPDKLVNALPEDEFSTRFLATKDIMKDEEILTDYYFYETDFSLAGL